MVCLGMLLAGRGETGGGLDFGIDWRKERERERGEEREREKDADERTGGGGWSSATSSSGISLFGKQTSPRAASHAVAVAGSGSGYVLPSYRQL
ncbi:hypothetical protein VTL71DRAFT_8655 [Oculimacula yallundae]|uniref:Uncharacterized protein n=1 Tax=Oculimacula yallundae TaxID=86028 RepID=A0ABR4CYD2_9HELO